MFPELATRFNRNRITIAYLLSNVVNCSILGDNALKSMPGAKREAGKFELDLGRYELRRGGRAVKLEKKPMELLIFLVARREQMVSRKDIVTKLWRSDLFIDAEANVNNAIRKIRSAFGDSQGKPRFLETVVGKGYRFIGPVRVIDARFSNADVGEGPAS